MVHEITSLAKDLLGIQGDITGLRDRIDPLAKDLLGIQGDITGLRDRIDPLEGGSGVEG